MLRAIDREHGVCHSVAPKPYGLTSPNILTFSVKFNFSSLKFTIMEKQVIFIGGVIEELYHQRQKKPRAIAQTMTNEHIAMRILDSRQQLMGLKPQ